MSRGEQSPLAADALAGLWAQSPTLPTKWLYDDRGSRLYDEITSLPEYYPARRETEILRAHAAEIVGTTGATVLMELGSGTSAKTRLLLDALAPGSAYVPVDVSAETLGSAAEVISADYPALRVAPVVADFTGELPASPVAGRRLVVFLGGTVGNFADEERAAFLSRLAADLAPGEWFLLGTDLIKEPGRLTAAYNDKAGVTADFNRNLIEVLRSQLDADGLYPDDFDHDARWNPADRRIEMWLTARRDVDAYFPTLDRRWRLPRGTGLLTEISVKFTPETVAAELTAAGLAPSASWTDPHGDFQLTLARRQE